MLMLNNMSVTSCELTAETNIADALSLGAGAAMALVRRGMACPGCAMAPFMSLAEAAASYGVPADQLLEEIRGALSLETSS
jgi:hybrid cluster-associated redox disulfide protein